MRGVQNIFIILVIAFLFSLTSVSASQPSIGSNYETSCDNNVCTSTIYSYEKYFNRNGEWEEIDESWHDCSIEGVNMYCTKEYHFGVTADSRGNILASRDGEQYSMRMNDPSNSANTLN